MPTQAPITQLRRAIRSLANKSGLAYDIAKSLATYDAARAFYVEMHDARRVTDDMVQVAADRLIELTQCDCEPDDTRPNVHLPGCAMFHRWNPEPLAGSGILKFSGGGERVRYDQDRTIARFAKAIAARSWADSHLSAVVDEDGVDASTRWGEVVYGIVRWAAEAAGATAPSFTGWRSGVAKRLNVSLDGLSDKESKPVSVRIEGRDRP